jgi:hypothetical protein
MNPAKSTHWDNYCASYWALLRGRMPGGWDLFEARLPFMDGHRPWIPVQHRRPTWRGERFDHKTLLLTWEQGFGDTLRMVRFAPWVKLRGGRVILWAQSALADVLETVDGIDQVVATPGWIPSFDLQASVLSLPSIFRTSLDSIPSEIPYVSAPPRVPNRASLDQALPRVRPDSRLRIGCAWSGNPKHNRDSERSIKPEIFAGLSQIQGVTWFAFQHGMGSEVPFPGVVPLSPHLDSFSDTAYALSKMDLVVCCDTSLAHLAGAMGIPVWLLVTCAPDSRWMLDRSDSPWYPSLRLFRQPRPGDWESVLQDVIRALGAM